VSPVAGSTLLGFATDVSLTANVPISPEAVFAQNRLMSGIASQSEPRSNALRIVYRRDSGPQEVLSRSR